MNPINPNNSYSEIDNYLNFLSTVGENDKISIEEKKVNNEISYNLSISGSTTGEFANYVPETVSSYIPGFFSSAIKTFNDKIITPVSRTYYKDGLPKTLNFLTKLLEKIEKANESLTEGKIEIGKNVIDQLELPQGSMKILNLGLNNLCETYIDRSTQSEKEQKENGDIEAICTKISKAATEFYVKKFKLLSSHYTPKSEVSNGDENSLKDKYWYMEEVPKMRVPSQDINVASIHLKFENRMLRLRNFQISEKLLRKDSSIDEGEISKDFRTHLSKNEKLIALIKTNNELRHQNKKLREEGRKSILKFEFASIFEEANNQYQEKK